MIDDPIRTRCFPYIGHTWTIDRSPAPSPVRVQAAASRTSRARDRRETLAREVCPTAMLAWTTSTMNAVRASESARATRAGGKARGTHRIASHRIASHRIASWGRMRDSRRPPRVDDASATTMDGVRTAREWNEISFVRVVSVSSSRCRRGRPSRARTRRERIARAVVGGENPTRRETPRERGARDDETRRRGLTMMRVCFA